MGMYVHVSGQMKHRQETSGFIVMELQLLVLCYLFKLPGLEF